MHFLCANGAVLVAMSADLCAIGAVLAKMSVTLFEKIRYILNSHKVSLFTNCQGENKDLGVSKGKKEDTEWKLIK